ncbi:MAG: serine hydrolase [Saprospiraceae bacterium]
MTFRSRSLLLLFLCTLLTLPGLRAQSFWQNQLRNWLPNGLYTWLYEQEVHRQPVDNRLIYDVDVAAALATADATAVDIAWPPADELQAEAALYRERELSRNLYLRLPQGVSPDLLPLAAGGAVRLLMPAGGHDWPMLRQYLRRYAPAAVLPLADYDPETADGQTPTLIPLTGETVFDAAELAELVRYGTTLVLALNPTDEQLDSLVAYRIPFLWLPQLNGTAERLAAEALFGAADVHLWQGSSPTPLLIPLPSLRLGHAAPEWMGMSREELTKVDYQINRAVRMHGTPGAQLLVAKGGKIVYEKAYGYHTYGDEQPVRTSDLYDLASLTKPTATTLAVMRLYEENLLKLTDRVQDILPEMAGTRLAGYRVENLLTHQTGIQPNLPVSKYLYRNAKYWSDEPRSGFSVPLSADRYLSDSVASELIGNLTGLEYTRRVSYKYSDVNYVLLQLMVERLSGMKLDEYVQLHFYVPLGLSRICFRPAERFPLDQIVPTSQDKYLRGGLVHGYVHDEGAALLGGVAGNAGLFASAADLAAVYQMLLNGGTYGGRKFFQPETVALFTTKNRLNHRALGFDRLAPGYPGMITAGAGEDTFGHTGFSGTAVWADPEKDLIFVLLTNRIHPDPTKDRFGELHTRYLTHQLVYRALDTYLPGGA